MSLKNVLVLAALISLTLTACGPDDDEDDQPLTTTPNSSMGTTPPVSRPSDTSLEVAGTWATPFGFEPEVITSTLWNADTVTYINNDENWAVVQAPADATFNPSTFSRIVWTEPAEGVFHYCYVEFALATEAAAISSTAMANTAAPEMMGSCGAFAFTRAVDNTMLEIAGSHMGEFGAETISNTEWNGFVPQKVIGFNNAQRVAIRQYSEQDPQNPSLFNRVRWTEPDTADAFYYCIEVFSAETAEAALMDPATSDSSSPATAGCNGGSWVAVNAQ